MDPGGKNQLWFCEVGNWVETMWLVYVKTRLSECLVQCSGPEDDKGLTWQRTMKLSLAVAT